MAQKPEDKAREDIDRMLEKAGWDVQDIGLADIYSCQGVVIRNFPLKPGGKILNILHLKKKAESAKPISFLAKVFGLCWMIE